jgi:hypothetical protein
MAKPHDANNFALELSERLHHILHQSEAMHQQAFSGEHSSGSTNMAQDSMLLKHLMQGNLDLQGFKLKTHVSQGMSHAMTQRT